mgnify:CR=1 FL=1
MRQEHIYIAIEFLNTHMGYSIKEMCIALKLNRSSYYKWKKRNPSPSELLNLRITEYVKDLYEKSNGVLGYRQMCININREKTDELPHVINVKRVRRIMRILGLKSVIRKKRPDYVKSTPEITAENILNRDFTATTVNEKWCTDVTEMKYGSNGEKAYLSAILDLKGRDIISFAIGKSNNNHLVFKTFDLAIQKYPDAHPLFHSDRGFQYTSKSFRARLDKQGMEQSMSRVGRCIDNGPMEGFWGILKRERYYGRRFTSRETLVEMITKYIHYYNSERIQRKLYRMTPMEFHAAFAAAA